MGSPVCRAPREELGEDSDNDGTESEAEAEGSESERPMPMAKAAPKAKAKAAPKPLSGWCALQAAIKQGDYSHLSLRVLCKSGEKCLQMSWGLLRFVDSMNVFPTSLASMIDEQLPELFPLMASLHPELQLRTPTDSPPQRRPLKQRRTHCDLEQAWDCILRKLPMPFEHFCGAEAWEKPAVWEQHCYDSVLAGKAVSAEDYRLAVNTGVGDLPQVPRLLNPDKFRNTNAYVDPAKFERAVGKSSVTNFEFQINDSEGFLAFVETLKTNRSKACMSVPTQVGARTLQLSKLMMEKAYYLHMRRLFPKMRLLFTDTDSVMVQIFELQDPLHAMAKANLSGATLFDVANKSKDPERDLSALSAAARAKAIEVMGQLGKLGDETFPARILEYVGLRSKMYKPAEYYITQHVLAREAGEPFMCAVIRNKAIGQERVTAEEWKNAHKTECIMFPLAIARWNAVLEQAMHNDFMYGALDALRVAWRIDQEYINPPDRKTAPWADQQWNIRKMATEAAHISLGMRQDIQAKYHHDEHRGRTLVSRTGDYMTVFGKVRATLLADGSDGDAGETAEVLQRVERSGPGQAVGHCAFQHDCRPCSGAADGSDQGADVGHAALSHLKSTDDRAQIIGRDGLPFGTSWFQDDPDGATWPGHHMAGGVGMGKTAIC